MVVAKWLMIVWDGLGLHAPFEKVTLLIILTLFVLLLRISSSKAFDYLP